MISPHNLQCLLAYQFPAISAQPNFDTFRLYMNDHIIHGNGTGITPDKLLSNYYTQQFDEISNYDFARFWNETPIYVGYTRISKRMEPWFKNYPDMSSQISGVFYEHEKEEITQKYNVILWKQVTYNPSIFEFYPSCQENYMLVYKEEFKQFSKEWVDEAIWFYTQCLNYIERGIYDIYYPLFKKNSANSFILMNNRISIYDGINYEDSTNKLDSKHLESKNLIIDFIKETLKMLKEE
jgi:hypothetical protein